jgi:hypothetical protein
VRVEVLYAGDCPHAADALLLVRRCADRLGVPAIAVVAREGDYPSPTVLVDGRDVMGRPPAWTRGCRLDLPTEERVLSALAEALP